MYFYGLSLPLTESLVDTDNFKAIRSKIRKVTICLCVFPDICCAYIKHIHFNFYTVKSYSISR